MTLGVCSAHHPIGQAAPWKKVWLSAPARWPLARRAIAPIKLKMWVLDLKQP
jgi:hypothetical protein